MSTPQSVNTEPDPEPFVFRFQTHEQRRHLPPTISRVGWRFDPRLGYAQHVEYYSNEQRRYA